MNNVHTWWHACVRRSTDEDGLQKPPASAAAVTWQRSPARLRPLPPTDDINLGCDLSIELLYCNYRVIYFVFIPLWGTNTSVETDCAGRAKISRRDVTPGCVQLDRGSVYLSFEHWWANPPSPRATPTGVMLIFVCLYVRMERASTLLTLEIYHILYAKVLMFMPLANLVFGS